jgi:hypothetical protein
MAMTDRSPSRNRKPSDLTRPSVKPRNHAAEYARRKQLGLESGLTLSQARGHSRAGEKPVSSKATIARYDKQLEEGVKAIRKGKSLSAAAHELRVSPEKLRRYIRTADIAEKVSGRYAITKDRRPREELLHTRGKTIHVIVPNYDAASEVGFYMQGVKRFLLFNNIAVLQPFEGHGVTDILGKYHPFETRPNVLYRLDSMGTETFEDVYRILA